MVDDAAKWSWIGALAASAFAVMCQQVMMWRFYTLVHTPSIWSVTYVFGSMVAMAMFIKAMMQALGMSRTTWRGTTYQGSTVVTGYEKTDDPTAMKHEVSRADAAVRNS